jgi:murein L,D-transpeptidase YcbB/YkuD
MMMTGDLRAGIPLLVLCSALILIPSCGAPPPPPPVELARGALMERIGPAGTEGPTYCQRDRICGSDILPGFYRARDFRPAWTDNGLVFANAVSMLDALRLVAADGLDPENYHLAALDSLLAEIKMAQKKRGRPVRPETLADLEMLLTDAFLLCGSHLIHGQVNPETLQSEWFVKGRYEDLAAVLETGLATGDIPGALESLRPGHSVYKGLKKALRDYRTLADAGGWPEFPPGPKLVKGDRGARVEALTKVLAVMGDLTAAKGKGDPILFDEGLVRSVKAFQRRHGLEPDGAVGLGTAAALNVPASERLAQLRANLERWRWITQDLGEKYILVNVADFRVGVVEAGREVLAMPAIVGTAYRRTPDFSGRLSYIEINPAWNVPPKLAREDILPKVQKDPGYLKQKRIRVFRDWTDGSPEVDPAEVDWSQVKAESLSYRFRQDPGPHNALGRIKFMFPNKFDIYLHDTPERGLFKRAVRDFSSGCIRVERPVELAEYVLRDDPDWTRDKLLAVMDDGETRVIKLRNPLGVHLLYWTAWLADDGRVQFRKDIYLRDAALFRALEERASLPGR